MGGGNALVCDPPQMKKKKKKKKKKKDEHAESVGDFCEKKHGIYKLRHTFNEVHKDVFRDVQHVYVR